MDYVYEFDETICGKFHWSRRKCQLLHDALKGFRDEIEGWNERSAREGGPRPYAQEVEKLDNWIGWFAKQLANGQLDEATDTISVGSCRLFKAALVHAVQRREAEIAAKTDWPEGAVASLREGVAELRKLEQSAPERSAEEHKHPPADILAEINRGAGAKTIGFR